MTEANAVNNNRLSEQICINGISVNMQRKPPLPHIAKTVTIWGKIVEFQSNIQNLENV